jgi:predicted alpha/beta hydrolase
MRMSVRWSISSYDHSMEYRQQHVTRGDDRVGVQVYVEPPNASVFAVIVPAMRVPALFYRPFAEELVGAGVAVAAVELRGYGSSTPAPGRASRYGHADLADDVGAMLAALEPFRRGRPTVLIGHCFGGQVCALHLALTPQRGVAGLALVASGTPCWRDYPLWFRFPALLYSQAIGATSVAMGYWPGWTIGGRQSRQVMTESAHIALHGRYPRLDGVDVEAALAKVDIPVLSITLNGDIIMPRRTTDRLTGKLTSAHIERMEHTVRRIRGMYDHFGWVSTAGPIATRIADWATSPPPAHRSSTGRPM